MEEPVPEQNIWYSPILNIFKLIFILKFLIITSAQRLVYDPVFHNGTIRIDTKLPFYSLKSFIKIKYSKNILSLKC